MSMQYFAEMGEEMGFKKEYEKWCTDEYFDDETKKELLAIRDDEEEKIEKGD